MTAGSCQILRCSGPYVVSLIAVWMGVPGVIVLTAMPWGASSCASARLSPSTPNFEAQ